MISKIKNLIKISFVRNTGYLQAGKMCAILLAVANSVILARLLKPELYGIYGLIFAFVGLVGTFLGWGGNFASLTLLSASYIREQKQEIKDILTYFVKITLLPVALIGVAAFVLAPLLTDLLYHNGQIGGWARIVLLATFLTVFYEVLLMILQVVRKIKNLTILETFNKLIYVFLPILFVLAGWGLAGLVWGYLCSAVIFLVLSLFLYFSLVKKDRLWPGLSEIFNNFKKTKLKKYFSFGFLIAIDKNLSNLVSLLPVIFLGALTVPQDVSYFKIAFAYTTIPLMVLGPVSRLLTIQLPQSEYYGREILKKHFYKTAFYSGLISILSIFPLIVLAPFLVRFFYGIEYINSIPLVYKLVAVTAFSGFAVGLAPFYRTVNRMKTSIAVNLCQAITFIFLVFMLAKVLSPLTAVIWSLIATTIFYLLVHFFIIKKILDKAQARSLQQ